MKAYSTLGKEGFRCMGRMKPAVEAGRGCWVCKARWFHGWDDGPARTHDCFCQPPLAHSQFPSLASKLHIWL